jgi:uncharacterized protein (DUF1697 family)
MPRYVALLRAVNLGKRNVIRMEDLRRDLAKAGFEDVSTLGNSGNAAFVAAGREAAIRAELEGIVSKRIGRPAVVLIRNAAEMADIVALDPFRGSSAPSARQAVTFLPRKPTGVRVGLSEDRSVDILALGKREIFSIGFGPPGRGGTPLGLLPPPIAAAATMRTWNVTSALARRVATPPGK